MMTKLVKWASNDGQIIKSGLSDGRRGKIFRWRQSLPTIGSELKVIWAMSGYNG
jgi:hypothetical protein